MEEIRHTVCETYFRCFDIEDWIVGDRDFAGFPRSHFVMLCRTRPFGCSEEIRRHCGHGPPLGSEMAAMTLPSLLDAMLAGRSPTLFGTAWGALGLPLRPYLGSRSFEKVDNCQPVPGSL